MMSFISGNAGLIGLLMFFAFFMLILLWVYLPGSKSKFAEHGQIPLREAEDE